MSKKHQNKSVVQEEQTEQVWDEIPANAPQVTEEQLGAFHVKLYTLSKKEPADGEWSERSIGSAKTLADALEMILTKGKEKVVKAILSNKYQGIQLQFYPDIIYDAVAEAEFQANKLELAKTDEAIRMAREMLRQAKETKKTIKASLRTPKQVMEESLGVTHEVDAEVSDLQDGNT
jgi:hypothetical protein